MRRWVPGIENQEHELFVLGELSLLTQPSPQAYEYVRKWVAYTHTSYIYQYHAFVDGILAQHVVF